jgi:hypothetical protein
MGTYRTMRWNVTTRAMRTINKYGSLDKYLLGSRTKWLGERAMWLRCRIRDEIKNNEASSTKAITVDDTQLPAQSKTALEKASEKLVISMPVSCSFTSMSKSYTFSIRNPFEAKLPRPGIEANAFNHRICRVILESTAGVLSSIYFLL